MKCSDLKWLTEQKKDISGKTGEIKNKRKPGKCSLHI